MEFRIDGVCSDLEFGNIPEMDSGMGYGSLSVWGDVWSFAVTEYVLSCDSGIFWSWWPKVVSPYNI